MINNFNVSHNVNNDVFCYSCNTDTTDLPDMHAQPQGCRPGGKCIYTALRIRQITNACVATSV